MKKLLLVLAAALALSVPAFADSSYFISTPYSFTAGNWTSCEITSVDQESPVYFYLQNNQLHAISQYSTAQWREVGVTSYNQSVDVTYNASEAFDIYFTSLTPVYVNAPFSGSSDVTAFANSATSSVIASAFTEFLASLTPPSPSVESSFTVPCGNVLYFKVDREQDVNFSATMPVLSSLLGTPTGAWNSGIEFGPAAALPSSGTTFPILSQDPINFAKSATDQNLLGQTKSALARKHCIAGQYYALYLPYHYGGWLALGSSHVYPDGSTSGGIVGANVNVSGSFAEIKVYPLSEKANGDLLTGSVTLDSGSDDGFASYFDGEISDAGTVTWLDQNGDISSPSVGGTSYVPEDVSTESIIDQIKNILSSIVSEIKNLFSFGYEAVNTLVGLMRDFVSVFQQLYEWLPSEVYSALISAIIVAITIGVFKVFL